MSPSAPSDAARTGRKARRHARQREEISAAALRVLAAHGVEGFSIAAVAREADVSKPAVYYYFADRRALIAHISANSIEAEAQALVQAIQAAPSGAEALAALVRVRVAHYLADPDAWLAAYAWPMVLGVPQDVLQARIYPASHRVAGALAARLQADQAAGMVRADLVPRTLANVAFATAQGLISVVAGMRQVGGDTRHTLHQLADEAVANLTRGVLPESARPESPR